MDLVKVLKESVEKNASDIILSAGEHPSIKLNGDVEMLREYEILSKEDLKEIAFSIMTKNQQEVFQRKFELDFSIEIKEFCRFRVNAFSQRQGFGLVFRPIKTKIPEFDNLNLPNIIKDFAYKKNGLVLVTGSVGSGKTTTLASLINEINKTNKKHIITVEDPIEFVFENENSLIEQREVGLNTQSFDNGLKYALRQAPDVVMIGEMRDLETFRLALRAAETGNLVFATLHTSGAARSILRIIDMFPGDEKNMIKQQLSESLIGVVWQQLLKTSDGEGRVAATEVMINNTSIANMIRKDQTHQIQNAIETGKEYGMHKMKESLDDLFGRGIISEIDYDYNLSLLERLY